jgi:hypothetical protein
MVFEDPMDSVTAAQRQDVMSVYQGEVLGEALFSAMAEGANSPDRYRQFAAMLQLETETKARLRPLLASLGLSVVEREESRAEGYRAAARWLALPPGEFLDTFEREIAVYRDLYQTMADRAPAASQIALQSMVEHEQVFLRYVAAEREGRSADALSIIQSQLRYPSGP